MRIVSEITPTGRGRNFPEYQYAGKKRKVQGEGFGVIFDKELRKLKEENKNGK